MRLIIFFTFLITAILSSCNSNPEEISDNIYFKDYDLFKQKGIDILNHNNLAYPYFEQNKVTDSTVLLTLHNDSKSKEKIEIPKKGKVIYNFFDIYDGPRHYFSKFEDSILIRYGYDKHPSEILSSKRPLNLYNFYPSSIEVISRDTFYLFSSPCYLSYDMNKEIPVKDFSQTIKLPFEIDINLYKNCGDYYCYYYNEENELWEYNNETNNHIKSDGGLYGFDKHPTRKWKSFHNIYRYL